ncbi:hypothetical protein [Mycobacterium sp. UM_CSW]|uniref:hypothetical protein n=1 Tax=Mycobacterium sp. UM_CSW TaxID=1370119 RepID=UPI000416ACEC|nr:hypothetical protein [Mycobacterium sp. UM_CSW]
MPIIARKAASIPATEAADAVKRAILPAAVFVVVQTLLAAEAISVILFEDVDARNAGARLIAFLLSVALLANLGLVCGLVAAHAAGTIRRWNHARARALINAFPDVSVPAEEPAAPRIPASR